MTDLKRLPQNDQYGPRLWREAPTGLTCEHASTDGNCPRPAAVMPDGGHACAWHAQRHGVDVHGAVPSTRVGY